MTVGAESLNAYSGTYISADEVLSGDSQILGADNRLLAHLEAGTLDGSGAKSTAIKAVGLLGEEGWLVGALDGATGVSAPGAIGMSLFAAGVPALAISSSATQRSDSTSVPDSTTGTVKSIDLTAAADSGVSSTDNLTHDARPVFAIPPLAGGTTPRLYVDGVQVASHFDAASNTLTPIEPLTEGSHHINYSVIDASDVESLPGTPLIITIDISAPVIDLDGATGIQNSARTVNVIGATPLVDVGRASIAESSNRIASLTLKLNGIQDGSAETLRVAGGAVGDVLFNADGSGIAADATLNLAGTIWQVDHSDASFVFTKPGGEASVSDAQELLRAMQYQHRADTTADGVSSTTDGTRTAIITAADAVGNVTLAPAVITLAVNRPRSILIDNVGTDNVLAGPARDSVSSIDVRLGNARAGDSITLHRDGVAVGTDRISTNGQTQLTVNFDPGTRWGADGERALTASIGPGSEASPHSVINSDRRTVQIAADRDHWSASAGVIWFDTDSLVLPSGSAVYSWNASAGASIATATSNADANRLPTLMRDMVNGHAQLYFGGGTANGNNLSHAVSMNFTDPNGYFSSGDQAFTEIVNAAQAEGGRASYVTDLGNYRTVVDASGTGAQFLSTQIYSPGTRSTYSIGAAHPGADAAPAGAFWKGEIGDVIWINRALGQAEVQEINTYEAVKFGSSGSRLQATQASGRYDLTTHSDTAGLLDDVLTLHDNALGVGQDLITTAGADYVNAGAGDRSGQQRTWR